MKRTYGKLERTTGPDSRPCWKMTAVPPHVCTRLKRIFPRIAQSATEPFYFFDTEEQGADLDWFLQRYPMQMSRGDRMTLSRRRNTFEENVDRREEILVPTFRAERYAGIREGESLRDYQAQPVELLRSRKSLLVADEVGLGKTYIAAGAMLIDPQRPSVVVVEPHVQRQWKHVIEAFTTLTVHEITKTKPYTLPEADVYIFRYSNIAGWVDVLNKMDVGLAVWDEIQALRTGAMTAKGAASDVLAKQARMRMGLTATPIYGYGVEIFNVMSFIDDTVLGTREEFLREHATITGKLRDPKALGTYLREQHVFLRRTRKDVQRERPERDPLVIYVDCDQKAIRSADDLAKQLALKASTGSFVERGQAARELDVLVRHSTGVGKAKSVANYVRILLEAGEPVLLGLWHRDVYDIVRKELAAHNPVLYTGSETAAQKERSKQAFLSGETNLMMISLRSGAGLDGLQDRCRTLVVGELDWSPGIHHQLRGRLDRDRSDGVVEEVMTIFLVADEGSDPAMVEVLGLKKSEARGVVDPGLGVQVAESDEGRLQKLVQKYLDERKVAA